MLLLLAALALAEEPDESGSDEDEADEVIVVEASHSTRGPAVRLISGEEGRQRGASTVAEALSWDPALHVRSGGRGEQLFSLHGFDQRQVAVFVDGVPASVPYDGQLDLGKLPGSTVGEAVVSPGGAAGVYGPGSLGGSVRIRTLAPPDEPGWALDARTSTQGAAETSAWVGGPLGPLRLRVSGAGRTSPGWPLPRDFDAVSHEDGGLRDASDRRSGQGGLRADLPLGRGGTLSVKGRYLRGDFGVPTGLSDDRARYWRFSRFEDRALAISRASPEDARVRSEEVLYLAANTNVLDAYDDATRTTQELSGSWHSTYRDHRLGGAWSGSAEVGAGRAVGWALVDHQVHRSVADVGEPEERVSTTLISAALAAEAQRGRLSGFLGGEVDGELPGQEGAFEPAPFTAGPSLGLGLDLGRVELALGGARRSRAPTLKERFSSSFGTKQPNLELGPETAWHAALDARVDLHERARLRAGVHDAEVRGLIEEASLGDGLTQNQNIGRARLAGAEAELAVAAPDWLTTRAGASWLHARRLDEGEAKWLEYRPSWQAVVEVEARPWRSLVLWSAGRWVGPQRFQDDDTLEWGRLGSYALWDAWVGLEPVPELQVRLRGSNLFDASWQSALGYPEPGRQLWIELSHASP